MNEGSPNSCFWTVWSRGVELGSSLRQACTQPVFRGAGVSY